mmetsp:Transcript_8962/g.33806  ORF Transcript_8962/g.33806 Transcript_8962/m.33806 type:complete len:285 (-) Transcript_8962:712-1566(-)
MRPSLARMFSISRFACSQFCGRPEMTAWRTFGLEPTSASFGIWIRVCVVFWMYWMVAPRLPITAPTRSSGMSYVMLIVPGAGAPPYPCPAPTGASLLMIRVISSRSRSICSFALDVMCTDFCDGFCGSGSCGICIRQEKVCCSCEMVAPPLPISFPTLSTGTGITSATWPMAFLPSWGPPLIMFSILFFAASMLASGPVRSMVRKPGVDGSASRGTVSRTPNSCKICRTWEPPLPMIMPTWVSGTCMWSVGPCTIGPSDMPLDMPPEKPSPMRPELPSKPCDGP